MQHAFYYYYDVLYIYITAAITILVWTNLDLQSTDYYIRVKVALLLWSPAWCAAHVLWRAAAHLFFIISWSYVIILCTHVVTKKIQTRWRYVKPLEHGKTIIIYSCNARVHTTPRCTVIINVILNEPLARSGQVFVAFLYSSYYIQHIIMSKYITMLYDLSVGRRRRRLFHREIDPRDLSYEINKVWKCVWSR